MNKANRTVALTSLTILALSFAVRAMNSSDPLLKRGQPLVKDLKGGEAHPYRFNLKAGQYAELTIVQRGIDAVAVVYDPAGKSLGEFDSPTGLGGTELVRLVGETAGEYKLVVRSLKKEAYGGSYEVKLVKMRPATAQDKRIVAAIKAQMLADELRAKNETRAQSLEQYRRALELWRAARDRAGEASTLRAMGFAYVRLNDDEQAYKHFDQSFTIWRAIKDQRAQAYLHLIFATIHTRRNELEQAVKQRLQALPLWRALGDRIEEASTLSVIGLGYARLRDKEKAYDYCQQSLAVSRATGNRSLQANALTWFGNVCEMFGETEQARAYFQQSLALWREMGRRSQQADLEARIEKLRQK